MTDSTTRDQAQWIKARASNQGGSCVQMRRDGDAVQVRDSKNPDGGILAVSAAQFRAWLGAAARGEFTPHTR